MQATPRIRTFLKSHFGYDEFRPLQEDIILTILDKKDCLVLMPTGAGKSLCFQLPSLVMGGTTLVISPLIALMKDQVDALVANGISAAFLNSSLTVREQRDVYERASRGQIKLLYVAPERFAVLEFKTLIQDMHIQLIAIDEAHCISEWGHDFRPEYGNLKRVRHLLPGVPVVALTATATKRVRDDIVAQLALNDSRQFIGSFNRENLRYTILPKIDSTKRICQLLKKQAGAPAIIYCFSRNGTESLAEKLIAEGFNALPYHAGLTQKVRQRTQEKFIRDQVPIIVATIAFGMGIDKPDIRLVIHADLPKTVEGYYQETGRAGRDGLPSECVLFYSQGDLHKHLFFINRLDDDHERERAKEKLSTMAAYCESFMCRRAFVLTYFGEQWEKESCENCDRCSSSQKTFDGTEIVQKILSCVLRTNERFGISHVLDVLKGSRSQAVIDRKHDTLSVFGIVKNEFSKDALRQLSSQLLLKGLLIKTDGDYPVIRVSEEGRSWLTERRSITLVSPDDEHTGIERTSFRKVNKETPVYDEGLFTLLRELRKSIADKKRVPPFIIFGDRTLQEMATYYPQSASSLANIFGIGAQKLKSFGPLFLTCISKYAADHNKKEVRALQVKTPRNNKAHALT